MFERLRHPRLNALLIGVPLGLSGGLDADRTAAFAHPGADAHWPLIAAVWLIFPPLATLLGIRSRRGRPSRWQRAIAPYLDIHQFLFWTLMSLGLSQLYDVQPRAQPAGHAPGVFFIACAAGFLIAGLVERRMTTAASARTR